MRGPLFSIIIPTLNEERSIGVALAALARVQGDFEVIIADGGSEDRTIETARELGARVIACGRGRGTQMSEGARVAQGATLLFLHADTIAPPDIVSQINEALIRDPSIVGGNCSIRFQGNGRPARFMTWLYPRLARLGLCYGDSGIFVRARVYEELRGFKPFPLFEDLDFTRRLKKRGRVVRLPVQLVTSSRRFEGRSFVFTFSRWFILQVLYWLGVSPHTLSRFYAPLQTARQQGRSV